MRDRAMRRLLAVLLAACFGFATVTPMFGEPCPHDASALAELALANGVGADLGHVHAAMPHEAQGASSHHHSGAGDRCTCLGACCGDSVVAVLPVAPRIAAPRIDDTDRVARSVVASAPRGQPAHSFPFATAPPLALNA